jgi:hypothetical protein
VDGDDVGMGLKLRSLIWFAPSAEGGEDDMRFSLIVRLAVARALSSATLAGSGSVRATGFSTVQSDLWRVPSESGWGLELAQQSNVIFATMYVYDAQNDPAWYPVTLDPVPATSGWRGDLYLTGGPRCGPPGFDPAAVGYRKTGLRLKNILDAVKPPRRLANA